MEPREIHNNVDDTVSRVRTGAHEVVDKVADATTNAAETLSRKGEQLKTAEQQFVDDCRGYIHDNPVTALGMAVGAGFILSRMLSIR
ncbi:YqjD family protein [Crenothrix sp.]|uniref:DUF883 family protein n=1 Tax=Crenothrix sp. TaxID=3100433 RepID=UPI00374D9BD4